MRQQVVQLGADARLSAHVRHVVANHARDGLLTAAVVLYQRQVITDPCTRTLYTSLFVVALSNRADDYIFML